MNYDGYSGYYAPTYNDQRYYPAYNEIQASNKSIGTLQQQAQEYARNEALRAADLVTANGLYEAINILTRSWESRGNRTFFDDSYKLPVLKVSGFNDGTQVVYTFLPENRIVYVKVSVPEYSISFEGSAYYNEPRQIPRQSYQQSAVAPQNVAGENRYVQSIKQIIGFDLVNNKRSASGHMLIQEVANGTAAYYAGIRNGDSLVKIDAYDTKNFDVSRIKAYIEDRHRAQAMLKIMFSHNGKIKTANIQM